MSLTAHKAGFVSQTETAFTSRRLSFYPIFFYLGYASTALFFHI